MEKNFGSWENLYLLATRASWRSSCLCVLKIAVQKILGNWTSPCKLANLWSAISHNRIYPNCFFSKDDRNSACDKMDEYPYFLITHLKLR